MASTRTLGVCYPLLAFTLTQSPTWTGWVVFAWTLPGLLCYLPAGLLIDRLGPRRVMICTEFIRGVLVIVLCLIWLGGLLQIEALLVIALLEGGLCVVSAVAETALIPAVAEPNEMGRALALHETSVHGIVLAGRPLGGFLFGIWPVMPFLVNIAFFALSMFALRGIDEKGRTTEPPPVRLLPDLYSGIVEVRRDGFLYSAMVVTSLTNLVFHSMSMIFIAQATSSGLQPWLFGMILAASGVGGAIGAFISPSRGSISERIREKTEHRRHIARFTDLIGLTRQGRSTLVVHVWTCTGAVALTSVMALNPVAFLPAMVLIGLAGGLSNVTIRTVFGRVPTLVSARVISVFRLGSYGAIALGPLVGTLLFENLGTRWALVTLTLAVFVLAGCTTSIKSLRQNLSPHWGSQPTP